MIYKKFAYCAECCRQRNFLITRTDRLVVSNRHFIFWISPDSEGQVDAVVRNEMQNKPPIHPVNSAYNYKHLQTQNIVTEIYLYWRKKEVYSFAKLGLNYNCLSHFLANKSECLRKMFYKFIYLDDKRLLYVIPYLIVFT